MSPDGAVDCDVVVVVVVPGVDEVVDPVLKVPSLDVAAPSLEVKLSSPEYVASAVSGEPDAGSAEVILHVATPPDIAMVFVSRSSHWSGPRPSMVNDTAPVGVAVLDASPVTFARSVGVVESTSATAATLVLESDWDADAAGNEPQTTGASAKVRPAASVGARQRRI